MDPLNLLGYLLVFLFVTVLCAMIYARLYEWKVKTIRKLDRDIAAVEDTYKRLKTELKEARAKESLLKAELLEAKKTMARESSSESEKEKEDEAKKGKEAETILNVLIREASLTPDKIEKARNYLERSDNAGLKLEDVLVLLGFVSSDELKKSREKAGVKT